nr:MAG TPA: Helix-turn-helix XRE-family like protein [Bacteriophage sp.]
MQLSRALNDYLEELDMKQADVCRASGMSDAHVSQIFSGKIKDPKASVIYKIAHAMGISVDALLDRAESYIEDEE